MSSTSARLWPSLPRRRIYSSGLYCVPYHKTAPEVGRGRHLSLVLVASLPSSAKMGADRGQRAAASRAGSSSC